MEKLDKALRLSSLLNKSQYKIESLLAYSEWGFFYLVTSYMNGKSFIIKELFTEACARRIDGTIDAIETKEEIFQKQKRNFYQAAQKFKDNLLTFEDNGTIYYLTICLPDKNIQDYPKIPSNENNLLIINELPESLVNQSNTNFSANPIYLGESLITKTESIITQTEDLITDDSSVYELEAEKSLVWAEEETKSTAKNFAQEEAKKKQIINDKLENKSKFQEKVENLEKYEEKLENSKKEFITIPSIERKANNQKQKNKPNKNQGDYQSQKNKNNSNNSKPIIQVKKAKKVLPLWFWIVGVFVFWLWVSGIFDSPKMEESASTQIVPEVIEKKTEIKKYTKTGTYSEGMAQVELNGKIGFVDSNGMEIISPKYDQGGDFHENRAWVKLNERWGFVSKDGKEIVPLIYDGVRDYREGMAWVSLKNKFGFINQAGEVSIPIIYEGARDFSEGLAWILKDKKVGFVDKTGKEIIAPKYAGAWDFTDELAGVLINGKIGFIDKNDNLIIPAQYDDLKISFVDGKAQVSQNGELFYINKEGKRIDENEEEEEPKN